MTMLIATTISLNMCSVNASLIHTLVKFNMNPRKIPVAVTMGCLKSLISIIRKFASPPAPLLKEREFPPQMHCTLGNTRRASPPAPLLKERGDSSVDAFYTGQCPTHFLTYQPIN
jgi:hypothetical protein